MDDQSERRTVTIRDAADASGLDRRSLQRHVNDGVFPNAFREQTEHGIAKGPWRIPIVDLDAAGITLDESRLRRENGADERDAQTASALRAELVALQAELEAVRAELVEERSSRRVAEALADERAGALEHARRALE